MPHTSCQSCESCRNCRADPWTRFSPMNQLHTHGSKPTGASAADRGVRPTIRADCAFQQKVCGIKLPAPNPVLRLLERALKVSDDVSIDRRGNDKTAGRHSDRLLFLAPRHMMRSSVHLTRRARVRASLGLAG